MIGRGREKKRWQRGRAVESKKDREREQERVGYRDRHVYRQTD